jgi:hypothetical protein
MRRQGQQLLHHGQAPQLHEQDDQEAVIQHQQAHHAAANKVSKSNLAASQLIYRQFHSLLHSLVTGKLA